MTSQREKPPEMNPTLKMSIGSVISNPIPDDEYLTSEGKKSLNLTTIFIIIDIILTILIFLQEYDFLTKDFKKNFLFFLIKSFLCIIILVIVIIFFWFHKYYYAQICRFSYVILGTIYYLLKFLIKIINLIKEINEENEENDDELNIADIIFLFIHLTTLIPRILAFFFSREYVKKLKKIRQIKLAAEHENFVEKIAARIEKGYTRWSNPNISYIDDNEGDIELNKKQFFDKNEDDININDSGDNSSEKAIFTINGKNLGDGDNKKEFLFDKKDE